MQAQPNSQKQPRQIDVAEVGPAKDAFAEAVKGMPERTKPMHVRLDNKTIVTLPPTKEISDDRLQFQIDKPGVEGTMVVVLKPGDLASSTVNFGTGDYQENLDLTTPSLWSNADSGTVVMGDEIWKAFKDVTAKIQGGKIKNDWRSSVKQVFGGLQNPDKWREPDQQVHFRDK